MSTYDCWGLRINHLDSSEHLKMFYVFIFQNKEMIYFPVIIVTVAYSVD